jgi:hypothetical protein
LFERGHARGRVAAAERLADELAERALPLFVVDERLSERRDRRAIAALSATPEFSKAFSCKAGSKMRPTNACVVW